MLFVLEPRALIEQYFLLWRSRLGGWYQDEVCVAVIMWAKRGEICPGRLD